ncbi:hypothetical protein NM688_g246 [Phlebia brevispora]|uniref:Uncharacterized protein n=1 Tax=Phlebia brevispora TaxID=194682 RepID=A0ACC1TFM7_9APHY|nr:hypothetical protein NM688_g246 [Phlebia brevispora]
MLGCPGGTEVVPTKCISQPANSMVGFLHKDLVRVEGCCMMSMSAPWIVKPAIEGGEAAGLVGSYGKACGSCTRKLGRVLAEADRDTKAEPVSSTPQSTHIGLTQEDKRNGGWVYAHGQEYGEEFEPFSPRRANYRNEASRLKNLGASNCLSVISTS